LLKNLASTEDPEEEELLHAKREHQAVRLAKGDLGAARAIIVAEEQGRNATLNIVSMMSQSAFPAPDDDQLPAPTVTELLAIMLSNALIVSAADELRDDLPALGTVEIAVGEQQWECRFDCQEEAGTTRPALRDQAEEQAAKICAQIDKEAGRRQGRLRWFRKWGCPGGLVAAVGFGGAAFIPGASELVAPAVVVGVPSLLGIMRLPTLVRRASDQTEVEKRAVRAEIDKAAEQLGELMDSDRRCTGIHLPDLRGYLNGLTEDSVRAAIRPLGAVPLPKTREFPSWTPRPPRRHPEIETEDGPPAVP
jgi:hypothetical protein